MCFWIMCGVWLEHELISGQVAFRSGFCIKCWWQVIALGSGLLKRLSVLYRSERLASFARAQSAVSPSEQCCCEDRIPDRLQIEFFKTPTGVSGENLSVDKECAGRKQGTLPVAGPGYATKSGYLFGRRSCDRTSCWKAITCARASNI